MQCQRGGDLRAVDQRQPFLGLQRQRLDAGFAQHRRCGAALACDQELAFAQQRQRHVRQRCQVARGADRTLCRDEGHQAGVEHGQQRVDDQRPHAGRAARQRQRLGGQHQAHHFGRQRRADADRMRADQVQLQRRQVGFADAGGRQLAEAGVHAIHRRAAGGRALHHGSAGGDGGMCAVVDLQRNTAAVHRVQLIEAEMSGTDAQDQAPIIGRFRPCALAQATALS